MSTAADLAARGGLPADLRFLLARYPRESWPGNLGELMHFWLKRHDMFRELGATLEDATARFREAKITAPDYARFLAPRLQFFLTQLEGHHHVEDTHYFPLFRAAEARLQAGFILLESDHTAIHDAITQNAEAANAFLEKLAEAEERQASVADLRIPAKSYAQASQTLIRALTRHLADEEDLIVPLVLDRGEQALTGVG